MTPSTLSNVDSSAIPALPPGPAPDRIPLTRPFITDALKTRVCATLDGGWITEGPVNREFEAAFAAYTEAAEAISVTSCTTGLEAVMRAIDLGPGDEVIVPDFTYPCTASIPHLLGATVVLVDIDPETMIVRPETLEAAVTDRTRAMVPVSLFGNPLDADAINAIARPRGIRVIEDGACGLGGLYRGTQVGTHFDATVFSLHPRKVLTTGEGGMITTADAEMAAWLRSYKNFGVKAEGGVYSFELMGTNLKLSDIQATVGLAMIEHLDALVASRRAGAAAYDAQLAGDERIGLIRATANSSHAYQSYPILIDRRDDVLRLLRERGVECQFGTHALSHHPVFQPSERLRWSGELRHSAMAYERCLVLPLYHGMTDGVVDRVVRELRGVLDEVGAGPVRTP